MGERKLIAFNFVVLITGILLVFGLVHCLKGKQETVLMRKDTTLTLRGVAIIGIVLHHLTQYFENLGPLFVPFNQSGYILTALFFLFSGWGCYYSLRSLDKKLCAGGSSGEAKSAFLPTLKWTVVHCLRIILDFVVIFIINVVLFQIFNVDADLSVKTTFRDLFTMTQPTWVSWYPKIQLLCYVILGVSYLLSKKHKEILSLAFVLVYVAITWKLDFQSMWYTSVLCFPIGLIAAKYLPAMHLKKWRFALAAVVFGIGFSALFLLQIRCYTNLFRFLSAPLFCLCVMALTGIVNFDNACLKYIGNISFEIYLIHLMLIRIFTHFGAETNLSIAAITILTILLAIPVNRLVVWMVGKIKAPAKSAKQKAI